MGIVNSIGDELKTLGQDSLKQVADSPKDIAKAVGQQIGFEHKEANASSEIAQKSPEQVAGSPEDNKDLLNALYGSSEKVQGVTPQKNVSAEKAKENEKLQKELEGKTPQEQQEIMKKRQELVQLHASSYYQPLIEKIEQEKAKPEDQERASDRVERLEMEDLQEKQKEEEKKKPISVDRAERSTEANRGATG